jgi:hypothetical protein
VKNVYTLTKVVLAAFVLAECVWLVYQDHRGKPNDNRVAQEAALAAASPLPRMVEDAAVQPSGFTELVTPLMANAALGQENGDSNPPAFESLSTVMTDREKIIWNSSEISDEEPLRLPAGESTLTFNGVTDTNRLSISIAGGDPEPISEKEVKLSELTKGKDGKIAVRIYSDESGTNLLKAFEVILPASDEAVGPPNVTDFVSNAYGTEFRPIEDAGINIYGNTVKLRGTIDTGFETGSSRLKFLLLDGDGNLLPAKKQPKASLESPAGQVWSLSLALPIFSRGTELFLVPIHIHEKVNGQHQYESKPIKLAISSNHIDFPRPIIEQVATTTVAGNVIRTKETSFAIQINTGIEGPFEDAYVLITRKNLDLAVGSQSSPLVLKVKSTTQSFNLIKQSPGRFAYQATTTLGSLESDPSDPVEVHIQTSGPRIVDFSPQNHMFGPGRMIPILYFDPGIPLDPDSAKKTGSYEIVIPGLEGENERTKEPLSAEYNPNDNSVRLTFEDFNVTGNFLIRVKKGSSTNPAGAVDGSGETKATDGTDTGAVGIRDQFGNPLEVTGDFVEFTVIRTAIAGVPAVQKGVTSTGPYVAFSEYTAPREVPEGFNPSDKVETRVSRLYYYRDAHRVAQIINRNARSYNRQAVDMAQQNADQARAEADAATTSRRTADAQAIEAAQKAREAEDRMADLQQQLTQFARDGQFQQEEATRLERELKALPTTATDAERSLKTNQMTDAQRNAEASQKVVNSLGKQVADIQDTVQQLRQAESITNETLLRANEKEELLRAEQFRREVAAAHADPDTYAPGEPDSSDPVQQVSVSVIGEGVIQLRGPLKGINIIRKMINEIDSPVGQVRVSIHTMQVNGENANRMEQSIGDIQRSVDQSRFLTLQCGEMLRKSVAQVASRRATEMTGDFGGGTQGERDMRYVESFFGRDFVTELQTIDSEFLHTGNKVLSLNSMDSTSLANALFIMALAKNQTRMEILETFDQMVQTELPRAEASYLESTFSCPPEKDCQNWLQQCCCQHGYCPLACNARFETLRGFFNGEIVGDETLTPIQREFIRLAQIFKARLVTEIEYKQRVVERSMIEERLGQGQRYIAELVKAKEKEDIAREKEANAMREQRKQQVNVSNQYGVLVTSLQVVKDEIDELPAILQSLESELTKSADDANRSIEKGNFVISAAKEKGLQNAPEVIRLKQTVDELQGLVGTMVTSTGAESSDQTQIEAAGQELKQQYFDWFEDESAQPEGPQPEEAEASSNDPQVKRGSVRSLANATSQSGQQDAASLAKNKSDWQNNIAKLIRGLNEFNFPDQLMEQLNYIEENQASEAEAIRKNIVQYARDLVNQVKANADPAEDKMLYLRNRASQLSEENALNQYEEFLKIESTILGHFKSGLKRDNAAKEFDKLERAFATYFDALRDAKIAQDEADRARRPLDHKKFLDMLVDDLEDKYIELLEGTRAHTANIDNYIKRVSTALDDDFNTQFYYPTFRMVRQAGRYRDVQFGQIETTSILANNRELGKVTPQATMEFDLPKRDILITEAMKGAKAAMDEYGALLTDPTFLSLTKMGSGTSTASQVGGASAGFSSVRNVLPGLDSSTQEEILNQSGPGDTQFGSAFESLIPDPAIYKFETGTGFEIRPVVQPDGQAVVFDFNYMYTTHVREPVRADEKHLGRVKQHYIDTDVQLSNYELREISRYQVQLKASRTARGVPLLEDVPLVGALFRPLPQQESSLQQNLILGQTVIFPTLFDLMGLRWAPAVADLDPLRLSNEEFLVRGRNRALQNRVYDHASSRVDDFLRVPEAMRRQDLYRTQESIPVRHPNGYMGPGLDRTDSQLQEGYQPEGAHPEQEFYPGQSAEGNPYRINAPGAPSESYIESYPLQKQQEEYEELRLPMGVEPIETPEAWQE